MRTAYLLMVVNDDRIVGFGIFSDDEPRLLGPSFTVATYSGETYESAVRAVADMGVAVGKRMGPRCLDALQRLAVDPSQRGVFVDQAP